MKAVKCPYCGGPTKRNGRTSSGAQRWRCAACGASTHRALRRHRRPLRRVPVVASVEGHAARDARRRPDLQAQDRGVLGGLAHAGARRRVPPGPLRRRDLARGTPGRADLLQRGSGGLVVHGAIRELEGVVGAHGADTGARRRGHRRRQRLRQGRARGLAPDQGAECLFGLAALSRTIS